MNSVQRKYIRNIKKLLPGEFFTKNPFLVELEESVTTYVQEHENITYDALCEKFGAPSTIAEMYFEQNPEQIPRSFSLKRRILLSCIIVVLVVVVVATIAVRHVDNRLDDIEDGVYITEIHEYPSVFEPPVEPIANY